MTIHPNFANLSRRWGANILLKAIHAISKTICSRRVLGETFTWIGNIDEFDMKI